jgi:ABC-type lipoprotein export system ATPase subunit
MVFESFSAEMNAGQVTALVGPSGSGKSTLLAVIAGYLELNSGSVALEGMGDGLPSPEYVAWVPQGANSLGSRSVRSNVVMGALSRGFRLDVARAEAAHWIEMVGLAPLMEQKARELSGGELQRLALARALASHRPIVLADEPSANLDRENTERISELLSSLRSSAAIIVATHDPVLVSNVDRVVEMRPL